MATPLLRTASFRGVTFGVANSEDRTGRRFSVDSIPGRDLPTSEDFGADVRQITFEAFVVGEDYLERAERLVVACAERSVPGRLSLPYMQATIVRPRSCVRRESVDERRMARFQLVFVVVDRVPAPVRSPSSVQALDGASRVLAAAGGTALAEGLAAEGVPNGVLVAAGDEVAAAGTALQALGVVRDSAQNGADLARRAAELVREAQSLVLEPVTLASKLSDAIELVALTSRDAVASLYAYRTLAALRPRVFASYLSTRNARLVNDAVRLAALGGWARAAARVAWPAYEDALAARRELELALDEIIDEVDDLVYDSALSLRSHLSRQVPPPNRKLPHLRTVTLPASIPAIVLAARLYDDATRDQEIVDRNHVARPGFLPAGVPLEILSDA